MPANNSSLRAACLYRNSDDRQENSVERQRQGVVLYAQRKGYKVVTEYVFDGIPGDEIQHHPDWKRLLREAGGKWSYLLVDEPSRLSREDPDYFVRDVKIPLKEAGVRVDSAVRGLLDWDTIAGDILALVDAHKSRDEVRTMSRRVLGGMARRAREGKWFGWIPPYGLRVERVIDPATGKVIDRRVVFGPEEEVRVVRFVFDAIANRGWSLSRVCRELEARGIKPPVGNGLGKYKSEGRWNPRTLHRWIHNRKYCGDLPWNERPHGKYSIYQNGAIEQAIKNGRSTYRHGKEDWIIAPDIIPPLIDRDTFMRAGAALAASKKRTNPNQESIYLFTHALVCHDCGAYLRGRLNGKRKSYLCAKYKEYGPLACYRNLVYEKPLLNSILAVLLDDVLNPARLDEIETKMKRHLDAERDQGGINKLKKQIAALDKNIAQGNRNLTCLPEDRLAGVVDTLRALEGEKTGLQARLKELETGASQQKAILDEARRQLWRLRESLEGDDEEAQAAVVREVVSRIEVKFSHEERRGKSRKKRNTPQPTGAILYVKPGLGLSCLSVPVGRCTGPKREKHARPLPAEPQHRNHTEPRG
jgi:DNA invertase Pin-like site-specific DNA recombinase